MLKFTSRPTLLLLLLSSISLGDLVTAPFKPNSKQMRKKKRPKQVNYFYTHNSRLLGDNWMTVYSRGLSTGAKKLNYCVLKHSMFNYGFSISKHEPVPVVFAPSFASSSAAMSAPIFSSDLLVVTTSASEYSLSGVVDVMWRFLLAALVTKASFEWQQ